MLRVINVIAVWLFLKSSVDQFHSKWFQNWPWFVSHCSSRQPFTRSMMSGYIGGLFIMLSAMSCINRLDPLQMPLFKNTFLMVL
jgi:hypothetical protein